MDTKKQAKATLDQLEASQEQVATSQKQFQEQLINSQYQSILSMLGHEKVAMRAIALR